MSSDDLYKLFIVVILFILSILGFILYKYLTPNIQKVSFFKNVEPTNIEYMIPKNKLNNKGGGKEYSFSLWLRINNWYNIDTSQYGSAKEKNIFSYGNKDTASAIGAINNSTHKHVVPGVWLDNEKNDLNIYVHTLKGVNQTIKVKNVPLKKWFKLTVVMTKNSVQVFLNSKLDVFTFLKNDIILPSGDLFLFTGDNKIDGEFANFVYYKQALTAAEVAKLYAVDDKPTKKSLLFTFVNVFKNIGKYYNDKEIKKENCDKC